LSAGLVTQRTSRAWAFSQGAGIAQALFPRPVLVHLRRVSTVNPAAANEELVVGNPELGVENQELGVESWSMSMDAGCYSAPKLDNQQEKKRLHLSASI